MDRDDLTPDQLRAWVDAGLDEPTEDGAADLFEPAPPSKWDRIMGYAPLHGDDAKGGTP